MASKRSQILEYIKSTVLPRISNANGYNTTPKLIERGWRHPTTINEFPAIFVATTDEKRRNETLGNPRVFHSELSIVFIGYTKSTKSNPGADQSGVQLDLDKLIEDITSALYNDITQNSLCTYTDILSVQTDDGDLAPVAGCAVSATFGYFEEANP